MTAVFRLRFVSLKLESYSAAEKRGYRRHCSAGSNEGWHESGAAHLFVAEVHGCSQVSKLEIFHEFVIGGESSWRAAQLSGIVPVEKLAHCAPFLGARNDSIADLQQYFRLWMPQSACGKAAAGLKV